MNGIVSLVNERVATDVNTVVQLTKFYAAKLEVLFEHIQQLEGMLDYQKKLNAKLLEDQKSMVGSLENRFAEAAGRPSESDKKDEAGVQSS